MKTFKSYFRIPKFIFLSSLILTFFQSCKSDKKEAIVQEPAIMKEHIIDVLTEDMEFQMPDTIPSGWNIIRYNNASPQTHFILIDKYPDGITLENIKNEVLPPFDSGMNLINEGKAQEGFAEFGKLPAWFSEAKYLGGTGLISGSHVAESIVKLDPGYYIFECYVKMSNGVWHTSMGMIKEVIVSDTDSGIEEPKADIAIEISRADGIVFNDSISRGKHIFSVFYKEQGPHEHFLGHDVNLVKLNDTANLEELNSWMDWSNPKGLIEPTPTGITFLGGMNNMSAGETGYFNATLEPGNYALISEVPNPASKNMLKTFVVTE